LAEKAMLTGRFLRRKLEEYEALRVEIDALNAEAGTNDFKEFNGGTL